MAPKRRSLRERDERAITGPIEVLPGQTAIDLLGPPQNETAQGATAGVEVPAARRPMASTGAPTPRRASRGAGEGARRLGIYFHPADFTAAKAAYLADWQNGGQADTFAKWIAGVLLDHAQLDPAQRAEVAAPARESGGGSTRSFALPQGVHDAVRAAVAADQKVGRWVTISMWTGTAIHAATQMIEKRNGGPLPAPPTRLPHHLTRR